MKENKLSIEINRSVGVVFEFTVNPNNTHLWIDSIVNEIASESPTQLGTEYKNVDKNNNWTRYKVVQFKLNQIFELKQNGGSYRVLYRYEPISDNKTRLIYFESVNEGDLDNPFSIAALKKLKKLIEHVKEK